MIRTNAAGPRRRVAMRVAVAVLLIAAMGQLVLLATRAHGDEAEPVCGQLAAWRMTSSPPALGVIATIDGAGAPTTTPAFNDISPPAWSHDGRLATYDSVTRQFVIRDAGGAVLTTFSHPAQVDMFANAGLLRWSPDGTRLSYAGQDGLSVVAADGSGSPTLVHPKPTPSSFVQSDVRWSPDSTRLAWSDGASLRLARADGTGVVVLGPAGLAQPSWAPDGSRLVWAAGGMLSTYRSADSSVSQVAVAGYPELGPVLYSPDGSRIGLVGVAPDGARRLLSVDPAGGDVRDLTPTSPALPDLPDPYVSIRWDVSQFAWSPDGTRLAWNLGLVSDIPGPTTLNVAGWTDVAAGTVEQTLFEGYSTWSLWMRWSPDGRWLAYSSDTSGFGVGTIQTMYTRVFASVVNLDGTVRHEIPGFWYQPEWNPAASGGCGSPPTTTSTSTTSTSTSTSTTTTTVAPTTTVSTRPPTPPGPRWWVFLRRLVCQVFRICAR